MKLNNKEKNAKMHLLLLAVMFFPVSLNSIQLHNDTESSNQINQRHIVSITLQRLLRDHQILQLTNPVREIQIHTHGSASNLTNIVGGAVIYDISQTDFSKDLKTSFEKLKRLHTLCCFLGPGLTALMPRITTLIMGKVSYPMIAISFALWIGIYCKNKAKLAEFGNTRAAKSAVSFLSPTNPFWTQNYLPYNEHRFNYCSRGLDSTSAGEITRRAVARHWQENAIPLRKVFV